jgi:hypothetical protein
MWSRVYLCYPGSNQAFLGQLSHLKIGKPVRTADGQVGFRVVDSQLIGSYLRLGRHLVHLSGFRSRSKPP